MTKNKNSRSESERYLKKKESLFSTLDDLSWSLAEVDNMVFEVLLFAYDIVPSEVKREMDADPNFLNYRKSKDSNYLEFISFESSIKNKLEKLVLNTFFKGVSSKERLVFFYMRAIYLIEKEFACEIDDLLYDSEYKSYKDNWLD